MSNLLLLSLVLYHSCIKIPQNRKISSPSASFIGIALANTVHVICVTEHLCDFPLPLPYKVAYDKGEDGRISPCVPIHPICLFSFYCSVTFYESMDITPICLNSWNVSQVLNPVKNFL